MGSLQSNPRISGLTREEMKSLCILILVLSSTYGLKCWNGDGDGKCEAETMAELTGKEKEKGCIEEVCPEGAMECSYVAMSLNGKQGAKVGGCILTEGPELAGMEINPNSCSSKNFTTGEAEIDTTPKPARKAQADPNIEAAIRVCTCSTDLCNSVHGGGVQLQIPIHTFSVRGITLFILFNYLLQRLMEL